MSLTMNSVRNHKTACIVVYSFTRNRNSFIFLKHQFLLGHLFATSGVRILSAFFPAGANKDAGLVSHEEGSR